MKTSLLKKVAVAGAATALLAGASIVFAQTSTSTASTTPTSITQPHSQYYIRIDGKKTADMWGDVSAVGTNWIKVKSWGGEWTVNVASSTDLRRKYEGKSSLTEFMVGDRVEVLGAPGSDTAMIINAKKIQNFSIQTKDATFSGTIGTTTSTGFSFTSNARGVLQVSYDASTKIYAKNKTATSSALITAGTKASVFGVWNRQATTLQAREIKLK